MTTTTEFATPEALDAAVDAIKREPCPDWCTLPAGHRYDSVTGLDLSEGVTRPHEHRVSAEVAVFSDETRAPDSTITTTAPRVMLSLRRGGEDMTAERAYELGKTLRQAALLAQRIEREMSR